MKRFLLAAVLVGVGWAVGRSARPAPRHEPPPPSAVTVVTPGSPEAPVVATRLRVYRRTRGDDVRELAPRPADEAGCWTLVIDGVAYHAEPVRD